MRLVDDAAIIANVNAAIVHIERTPSVTVNAVVNVEPWTMSSATQAAAKHKVGNMRFYKNKKALLHRPPLSLQLPALRQQ
jgi:hypothetical protein